MEATFPFSYMLETSIGNMAAFSTEISNFGYIFAEINQKQKYA